MGKKGNKRKTRWRVLSIGGEDCGGSVSANEDEGDADRDSVSPNNGGATYARAANSQRMLRNGKTRGYQQQSYYKNRSYSSQENGHQPLVTTEKKTFNEEEYTKITTPRQDVLFKKGYLGRKRPTPAPADTAVSSTAPSTPSDVVNGNLHADGSVVQNGDIVDNEHIPYEALSPEDTQHFVYTNGYVDPNGLYYINGSSYELYDPYSGNVTVVVGPAPHFPGPGGGPPVLAAVPCQPLPLQPLEWFNPAFVPYVASPCLGKTYSTDSQNCSPQSSESTGPPGSPQDCDEVVETPLYQPPMIPPPPPPTVAPTQPPAYVYPGYMFGAPVYNMNGVTVQGATPQPLLSDVGAAKKRKKKRRRRRRRAGLEEGSEESSSDEKDLEEPASVTSQESSSQDLAEVNQSLTSAEITPSQPSIQAVSCQNSDCVQHLQKQEQTVLLPKQHFEPESIPSLITPQIEPSSPKDNSFTSESVPGSQEDLISPPANVEYISNTIIEEASVEEFLLSVPETKPAQVDSLVTTSSNHDLVPEIQEQLSSTSLKPDFEVKVNGYAETPNINGIARNETNEPVIVNGYHSDESSNNGNDLLPAFTKSNLPSTKRNKNVTPIICNGNVKHSGKLPKGTRQKNAENNRNLNFKMDRNGQKKSKGERKEEDNIRRANKKSFGNDENGSSTSYSSNRKQDPAKLPTLSLRPEKPSIPKNVSSDEKTKPLTVQNISSIEDSLLKSLTENTSSNAKNSISTFSTAFTSDSSKSSKSSSLSSPDISEKETIHFLSEEQKSENLCRVSDEVDEEEEHKPPTPVPPPRRKKLKSSMKRLVSERAPTPGRELVESSSSSSSKESEESVIELLSNSSPGPECKGFVEDDDEDDDVIFRAGSTNTIIEKTCEPSLPVIEKFACDMSELLMKDAIDKASKEKLLSARPITEAVTKWLRSQSPEEVLSLPPTECSDIESSLDEEEIEEDEKTTGQKNVHRNPLPVSSHKSDAGRRVAESIGYSRDDLKTEEELKSLTSSEGEWDHYGCKSFSSTPTTMVAESPEECHMDMCNPALFVAKYYRLGPAIEKISNVSQFRDTSDLDSDSEELDALKHFKYEMIDDRSENAQNNVGTSGNRVTEEQVIVEEEKKYDSGVQSEESGDESSSESAQLGSKSAMANMLQHQSELLVNHFKGDGPFPCGICCIIQ